MIAGGGGTIAIVPYDIDVCFAGNDNVFARNSNNDIPPTTYTPPLPDTTPQSDIATGALCEKQLNPNAVNVFAQRFVAYRFIIHHVKLIWHR